jgi:hypothetical protein
VESERRGYFWRLGVIVLKIFPHTYQGCALFGLFFFVTQLCLSFWVNGAVFCEAEYAKFAKTVITCAPHKRRVILRNKPPIKLKNALASSAN